MKNIIRKIALFFIGYKCFHCERLDFPWNLKPCAFHDEHKDEQLCAFYEVQGKN